MLRYKGEFSEMGMVDRSVEPSKIVPRVTKPEVVQLMGMMDDATIIKKLGTAPSVEVRAAMAMGKSTAVPQAIANYEGKTVLHVVPSKSAVIDNFNYQKCKGLNVRLLSLPQHGIYDACVNVMSGDVFSAKWMRDKFEGKTDMILFLDETQESDAFTACIRMLADNFECFTRVFRASATPVVTEVARIDPPGEVKKHIYVRPDVAKWTADDVGRPWHYDAISEHTMIALDRKDVVDRLAVAYERQGIDVVKLTSRSDPELWSATNKALVTKKGVTVVFVDSSFRSAITPVAIRRFIDSGEVGVPMVLDGRVVTKYRDAYIAEAKQFEGRAGRIKGTVCNVYIPNVTFKAVSVDLTQLEGDAANLLLRCFGYKPPTSHEVFAYYEGDVPDDIGAALMSDDPLRLYPADRLVPWVQTDPPEPVVDDYQFVYRHGQRREVSADGGPDVSSKRVTSRLNRGVSCHTVANSPPMFNDDVPPLPTVSKVHHRVMSVTSDDTESIGEVADDVEVSANTMRFSLMDVNELNASAAYGKKLPQTPVELFDKVLSHNSGAAVRQSVNVDALDCMYYYPGIENAGTSYRFVSASDVVAFTQDRDFPMMVVSLTESDALVAMRLLVDAHNEAFVQYSAHMRVMNAVSTRGMNEWAAIVDKDAFIRLLQAFVEQITRNEGIGKSCRIAMARLIKVPLMAVSSHEEAEHALIRELVARIRVVSAEVRDDSVVRYLADMGTSFMDKRGMRQAIMQ